MSSPEARLFTPRFFLMWSFTFTVFLSELQLLPTAPFHIRELGGSALASGLFLGCLAYASAASAPFMGALADQIGLRRMLLSCSVAIAGFSFAYAVIPWYQVMLLLALVNGICWSGLMTASGAYMTAMLPVHRRAEGIGYWGLASVVAVAVAPPFGFWIYRFGWFWVGLSAMLLNLVMATIARALPEPEIARTDAARGALLEWRVLGMSITLLLYSFGYGGVTSFSAMYAEASGVTPKSLYLTTLALAILVSRPLAGRFADRLGYRRIFVPALILTSAGLALLAWQGTRAMMLVSALVFGLGFGTAYPVFVAYVMQDVPPDRRGAAFGAIIASFDVGIGTGSTALGWLISHLGFARAFGVAAAVSTFAVPYFLMADRAFTRRGT